jgi:hypothetical protein
MGKALYAAQQGETDPAEKPLKGSAEDLRLKLSPTNTETPGARLHGAV